MSDMLLTNALGAIGAKQARNQRILDNQAIEETHGIFSAQRTQIGGATTLTAFDGTLFANTGSGTVTVNLPTAVGIGGRIYAIVDKGNAGTHNITVNAFGGETISGSASATISSNYGRLVIQSDGLNWYILSNA